MDIRGAVRLARLAARSAASAAFLLATGAFAESGRPPVAVAAHLFDAGDSARLSFDLSGPVEARARPISDPDRIIVDFPEVVFHLDASTGRVAAPRADAIVKAFRFGLFGPGKSRIVIELARPACLGRVTTKPIAKGSAPSRLTVELEPCDANAFAAAARAANPPATAATEPPSSPAPAGLPVIVLDPGHGGADGGASGNGMVEKSIVFDYALELQRRLEATGKFKVVLTRNGDSFVSLGDRVRMARDAGASLFISIHADALGVADDDVSGATVYTCSDRASDAEAARIAERENAADRAGGAEAKAEDAGVADILFDLKRRETRAYAHIFSRGLVAQWQGAGRLNHHPERSAGFVVLKAPDFPSVLVELGYLSNARDVANMTSADWRAKTATAMTDAILRFFAPAAAPPAASGKAAEALAASEKPAAAEAPKGAAARAP